MTANRIDRAAVVAAFAACPNCKGVGWTVRATMPHGEAEQVQCECSAILAAIQAIPSSPAAGVGTEAELAEAIRQAWRDPNRREELAPAAAKVAIDRLGAGEPDIEAGAKVLRNRLMAPLSQGDITRGELLEECREHVLAINAALRRTT